MADSDESQLSRRGVLNRAVWAGVGGLAVGAAGGGAAGWAQASSVRNDTNDTNDKDTVDLRRSYPYYGQAHPAGVQTEPQRYCMFMSFKLAPGATRQDLQRL